MARRFPCFYQLFLDSTSSERLLIPSAFSKFAGDDVPNDVFLRNSAGKFWHVRVKKYGNQWYFDEEWKCFVEDNQVKLRDFFVFTFDGEFSFEVKHYGENACQKKIAKLPGDRKKPVKDEDNVELENEEKRENHKKVTTEEEIDEEGENADDAEEDHYIGNNKRKDGHKSKVLVVAEEKQNVVERRTSKVRIYSKRGPYKRRALTGDADIEDDKIFEYGVIPRPENPYFLSKILTKIPKGLKIPSHVMGDFNLELPKELLVVDEKGSKFMLKATRWDDGRTWLSGGWQKFCYDNNMAKGDICICELVRGEEFPKDIYMKVLIVRANSWLPKEDGMKALALGESAKDKND